MAVFLKEISMAPLIYLNLSAQGQRSMQALCLLYRSGFPKKFDVLPQE